MNRHFDESTGTWFNHDRRCSACYLGHGHSLDKHIDSIALHETWGKVKGPWTHWASDENRAKHAAWIAEHRHEFVVYDAAR